MKILRKDLKHAIVQVELRNIDDLWALYNVIEKGDQVFGRTTREVKSTDSARPSSRRVTIMLGISVQKTYFDRDMDRLRVHGIVSEAPEDLKVTGSHHTLSVGPEDSLTIVKERWLSHHVERLERAAVEEEPIAILALDSDEAAVAILRTFGLEFKGEVRSWLPGKAEANKRQLALKEYFVRIGELLETACSEIRGPILVVGPGFTKDQFAREVRSRSNGLNSKGITLKSVGSGGMAGVHEAIRVGAVHKIRRNSRAVQETELVGEALKRVGRSSGDVSYGFDRVEADANAGAVDTLIVVDQLVREAEDVERSRIETTMRKVESAKGKVTIVSGEHEAGRMLRSLGGVIALLRYRLHQE